jgi:hypothetical protein
MADCVINGDFILCSTSVKNADNTVLGNWNQRFSFTSEQKKSIWVMPVGITHSQASTYWIYTFIADSV